MRTAAGDEENNHYHLFHQCSRDRDDNLHNITLVSFLLSGWWEWAQNQQGLIPLLLLDSSLIGK